MKHYLDVGDFGDDTKRFLRWMLWQQDLILVN